MSGKVKVEVDLSALLALRDHATEVLADLDKPVLAGARLALDQSAFFVPRGGAPNDPVDLATTGFVSGPHVNLGPPLSTTFFSGYSHPAAGAIHAGFHFGVKTREAPDFMRKAMRGVKARTRKDVAAVLLPALSRVLPSK